MTIAWKLFYLRTSRDIRSSRPRQEVQGEEDDDVLDSRRRDRDRDASVRRPSRPGRVPPCHPLRRAVVQQERDLVVLEKRRTSDHRARNKSKSTLANVWAGRTLDDRLPGSVMEARARLTERLRGCCHLAARSAGAFLDNHESVELGVSGSGSGHDAGTASGLQEETFDDAGEADRATKLLAECSICLESFMDGEGLIRLHCGHRFHQACLAPWTRAHGACPYCRACV